MTDDVPVRRFAFGAPVLPRPPSATGPRRVYVLGAYPSGLHVRWTPPRPLSPVRALLVDNEPTPFWDGTGQDTHIARWKDLVGWSPEWGEAVAPAEGVNGPSGAWVDRHVLEPLGMSRDDVCISDCLDTARLNDNQRKRVDGTYNELAERFDDLPPCTVEAVPAGEDGIVQEARRGHLDRLDGEIETCNPSVVITLGNAALRVLRELADRRGALPRRLTADGYGRPVRAFLARREMTLLPLVHPRNGERHPDWSSTHRRWIASRPTLH